MENNIDPWLYPGCPCWCWCSDGVKQLRVFGHYEHNNIIKKDVPVFIWDVISHVFTNYKPIGTPWDFAPKKSDKISIDLNGTCYFLFDYGNGKNSYMSEYKFPWHDCPDHLKGQVWQRPEWAK